MRVVSSYLRLVSDPDSEREWKGVYEDALSGRR